MQIPQNHRVRAACCALLWASMGGGCGRDDELVKQLDPSVSEPDITLEPWSLDFGAVPLGEQAVATVTVTNRGSATLVVDRVSPEGGGAFSTLDLDLPVSIGVGEDWEVEVIYTAMGTDAGRMEFGSSDPDSPAVSVDLRGAAAFPRLETDPETVSVGRVVRCGEDWEAVSLINVGEAELNISDLSAVGVGWSISDAPTLPLDLEPGAAAPVTVRFSPGADGEAPGSLYITSNDPRELVDVPLVARGEGYAVDERSETFIQPGGPYDGVDMVFFVDQSASMDDERRLLGERFPELVDELDALDVSWQAGVVTADDGCTNTGIISGSDPDAVGAFQDGLYGDWGWFAESGLTVALHALEAAVPGGCNNGLLRADALPLVVVVADERDHSEEGWLDRALAMSEAAPGVIINAVVGPVPDGCETASPGAGYTEAADWAGGVLETVCDPDWEEVFQDLGSLAADAPTDTFVLDAPPEEGSVEVLVNGLVVETGWVWDAEAQAVVFEVMPPAGAIIEVRYVISSDCG